jgi:hypothetical protein
MIIVPWRPVCTGEISSAACGFERSVPQAHRVPQCVFKKEPVDREFVVCIIISLHVFLSVFPVCSVVNPLCEMSHRQRSLKSQIVNRKS